jgi:Skp family chaperone for outer membrane proteins
MRMIALTALLALAACDGPRENAGENADFAAGEVGSNDTLRQGPAEQLGEAQDVAEKRAKEAKEAEAKALEAQAEEKRKAADQEADALEDEAARVRNN